MYLRTGSFDLVRLIGCGVRNWLRVDFIREVTDRVGSRMFCADFDFRLSLRVWAEMGATFSFFFVGVPVFDEF